MKHHLPVILLVLAVVFICLALPAQNFAAARGASQNALDWTFGSCLILAGLSILGVACMMIPWKSFRLK